jgi:DNA-binding transcriptional MerR regulator
MQKKLTQIPLEFGTEPNVPLPPSEDAEGAGGQRESPYMAAAGVGVRVKSYKNTVAPASAEGLFPEVVMPQPGAREEAVGRQEVVQEVEVMPESGIPAAAAEVPAQVVTAGKARGAVLKTGPSKRGRKSLKQVAAEADLIEIPADEVLFGKQYYTMGEVSEMFKVNQSLLRYWESEFDILQPRKNKKGDRYFRPVDIKNLHLIYHLLRQKKYTIEGARDFLKNNKKARERFEVIERLQQIRNFLLEWKAQL